MEKHKISELGEFNDHWVFERSTKMHKFIMDKLRVYQKEKRSKPTKIVVNHGIDADVFFTFPVEDKMLDVLFEKNIKWDMDADAFTVEIL
jgi:hypothetical protein